MNKIQWFPGHADKRVIEVGLAYFKACGIVALFALKSLCMFYPDRLYQRYRFEFEEEDVIGAFDHMNDSCNSVKIKSKCDRIG